MQLAHHAPPHPFATAAALVATAQYGAGGGGPGRYGGGAPPGGAPPPPPQAPPPQAPPSATYPPHLLYWPYPSPPVSPPAPPTTLLIMRHDNYLEVSACPSSVTVHVVAGGNGVHLQRQLMVGLAGCPTVVPPSYRSSGLVKMSFFEEEVHSPWSVSKLAPGGWGQAVGIRLDLTVPDMVEYSVDILGQRPLQPTNSFMSALVTRAGNQLHMAGELAGFGLRDEGNSLGTRLHDRSADGRPDSAGYALRGRLTNRPMSSRAHSAPQEVFSFWGGPPDGSTSQAAVQASYLLRPHDLLVLSATRMAVTSASGSRDHTSDLLQLYDILIGGTA
ncbi:hypothetical protein AAG570_007093 [Ranatra chinensis]|uniref:Uncharacterized protein n=1 Tax=Ranatra chinensis TaxID=642074 RepID=A0ABD0XW43_9HEMI